MTISELMQLLSGLRDTHGDARVILWDEEIGCAYSVRPSRVEFVPDDTPEDACVMITFDQSQITD